MNRRRSRRAWIGFIADEADSPAPAFYFKVEIAMLDDVQLATVRAQASEAATQYASTERRVVRQAFAAIIDAVDQVLAATGPNAFLVRIAPHATDPLSQVEDDRATVEAWTLRFAEHTDPLIARVWRQIRSDLGYLNFGHPDRPDEAWYREERARKRAQGLD